MVLIIIGLLLIATGVFVFLTSVNYSWILWEKARVDNLTKQIRPEDKDDLFKRKQVREYTQSFDIRSMGKSGVSKAQRAYEKTMVAINEGDYPSWVSRAIEIFNQTRKDFFASISSFIKYLMHLAKPDEYADPTVVVEQEAREAEVDQAIQRVKETVSQSEENSHYSSNQNQDIANASHHRNNVATNGIDYVTLQQQRKAERSSVDIDNVAGEENVFDDSQLHADNQSPIRVKFPEERSEKDTATIGIPQAKSPAVTAAFEKMEARILDKLKLSGLNHYNVWIELGELYMKFDEKDKASEVFALVLKNTKDDREKEVARNHLIGL